MACRAITPDPDRTAADRPFVGRVWFWRVAL